MEFWGYFFELLFLIITVLYIKKAVRAFVIGKKAGILKVRIEPVSAFLFSVICIFAITTSVNNFSSAKEYRDQAASYEKALSKSDGASLDSRVKYEETIRKLRANADTTSRFAWYMVFLGANSFALIFISISYFTEEGIVTFNTKVPEPVTAVLQDGKINVTIVADTHKNKPVWSFKKTPQNLAVFGRFIEWDETENEAVPAPETAPEPETESEEQPAPPPDSSNMQT